MNRLRLLALVLAALALVLGVAACGDDDDDGGEETVTETTATSEFANVTAVDSEACEAVEYEGSGDPTALIVSDLPAQGDSAERTAQMNDAIRQALTDAKWKAGQTDIAFQACDDSLADTGEWDEALCKANATAYAENPDVLGVIGTYNSGCAAVIVPILNEASGGGVAMVSPGNTLICLTEPAKGCEAGQPDSLYPSGTRNYARVVPNDAVQGAALATFAQRQQVRKPYVLVAANDPTSTGQANTFTGAAEALGMQIAGTAEWDPEATDYTALMNKVKKSRADALVLAGLLDQNGAKLIKDKVAVLGPNEGDQAAVQLFAPDGFAQQATIDDTGPDSAGMFVSVPGRLPETLTGAGKTFVTQLQGKLGGEPVELFAPYAGAAAQVLLQAASADATRAAVVQGLLKTKVQNGIVGNIAFTPTGDAVAPPISVSVAKAAFQPAAEITPEPRLVEAARGTPGG